MRRGAGPSESGAAGAPPSLARTWRSPLRRRRLSGVIALAAVLASEHGLAQDPVPGRYRCYVPPAYTVLAWFDLDARTMSVNGDAARPYRVDPAGGRIELDADALPPWRTGRLFAPGAPGGDAQRVTIVLAANDAQRPGSPGWETLPRCYLTTH